MTLQTIIERLDDYAKILDEDADKPYQAHYIANLLRATAVRIKRDAELEHKIAMATLQHNLETGMEDIKLSEGRVQRTGKRCAG